MQIEIKIATKYNSVHLEIFCHLCLTFFKMYAFFCTDSALQKNVTEVVGDVLKVGGDATEEAAKIGVKALGAAPSILEQKVAFAQGLAKTIQESSGQVKQVSETLPKLLPNSQQIDAAGKLAKTFINAFS